MTMKTLMKDPLNLIIVGVGGQGNVVISQLIGNALVREGYLVTFGQTYPSWQRGGTVINFIRISKELQYSPIIPEGGADIILGMEAVETMRMLVQFGNPGVTTIVNPRAIHSINIAGGEAEYPDINKLIEAIKELSAKLWVIYATEEAQKLGNPMLANVILLGALIGSGTLPLDKKSLEPVLRERFPKLIELNMTAFGKGMELIGSGVITN
jgi:indolepyruvate ferredoxin oxidoreductase beta subunit